MKLPLRAYLFFSLILGFASAQITGTVSDPNGNPLAGANVVVSGTSYGAAAASDGTYSIDISDLAGQASVLIFPDLNTGNNTYKAIQRETGALAIGPMLQGLNKPVNDLSRGCTVDDIFNTVLLTAIQAEQK